jgi:alkylation response protein AidB-like acyl-CoA dehydrogenase
VTTDEKWLSGRDLDFYLWDWLNVDELPGRERFEDHSSESFRHLLQLSRDMAITHFAPHYRSNDVVEPALHPDGVRVNAPVGPALEAFTKAGFIGAAMDQSLGGYALPTVVLTACMSWFHATNISTTSYMTLTMANASLLAAFGSPEQVRSYVTPMLEGRYFGTMCISESTAGSSVGDLTTRSVPDGDRYRIFGDKMWISAGDQDISENIVHLVLARAPEGGPGPKGLSLYLVPKILSDGQRNDVVAAGVNHKMGWRGTSNTALNFGGGAYEPAGASGAIGELIGEHGHGLTYMFRMMNEARISVGTGAAALGYASYLDSLAYAADRVQGRLPSRKRALGPQSRLVEHADVRRMLLAQKAFVEAALAFNLFCARLVDDELTAADPDARARAARLLGILTPIAKSWPSQWCLAANELAIQVMGGAGYTRDFDVELRYRDNRLNMIHEGTHGIQGIDLLGRKVRGGSEGYQDLRDLFDKSIATAQERGGACAELGQSLDEAARSLDMATERLRDETDVDLALANASPYLEVFGHVVHAWIWLELVIVAGDRSGPFFEGKRRAAQFFHRSELPKAMAQIDVLLAQDRTAFDMDPESF